MSGQEALSGERTSPFDAGDGSCCSKTGTHATATASESETQPAGQPQPVSAKAPPHQQRGKKPKVKPADATIIAKYASGAVSPFAGLQSFQTPIRMVSSASAIPTTGTTRTWTTAAGYNNFATTGGSGPTPAGIMASGGCGTGRETVLHGDATLNYDSLAPLGTGSERRLLNFGTTRPGSSNASRPASATSRHQRRMMQARRGKDDYGAEYFDLFSRLQKLGSTSAGRETTGGAKTIANLGGASFQFGDHDHPSNYYPPQSASSAVLCRREQNDVATGAVSRPQSGLTTSSYYPRPQSAATADGKTLPAMQQMQLPVRKKSPVQKWKQHCAKKMIKEWKEQQKLEVETVLQEQRLLEEEANRTPTERLKIKLKQQFFRDEDDMEVDVYEDDGASEVMSMSSPEEVGEQEQAGGSGLFSSRSTATRPQSSTGGGPQHQRPLSGVSSTGGARPLSGKTQTQSQSSKQRSVQENSLYLEKLGISETDKGPVLTCLAEALITSAVTPSASRPASSAAAAGGGGGSGMLLNDRSGQNKSSSKLSLRTASAHDVLPDDHGDTDTPRSTHEHADHCDDPLHGGFSAGSQKSDAELVQALAKGRDVPDEEFLKDLNYLDAIHAFPRGDGELKSRFSVCDGSSMERISGIQEDGEDDENDLLVGRSFLAEDRSQERVGESVFHLTETKFADHSGSTNAPPVGGAPATSLVFAERRVASSQDETLPKNTSSQILLAVPPRSGDHAAPSPTASSGATKSASTNLLGGEKKKKKTKRKPLPPPKPVYVKPADPAQIKRVAGLMRTLDDLVETSKILGDACDETADELSKLKKRSRYEQEAIKLLGVEVEKMQLGTGGKGVPLLDVLTRLKLAARDVERKEEHENEAKKERMRSGAPAEMDGGGAGSAAGGSLKKLHSNMSKSVSQVFNQRDSNSFAGTQQSFIGKLHQRDIRCETSKNLHADRKRPKSATERMRDTQEVLHVDEAHCPLNPPPPARPDEEVYQEPSKQKKHPEVARLEHGSGYFRSSMKMATEQLEHFHLQQSTSTSSRNIAALSQGGGSSSNMKENVNVVSSNTNFRDLRVGSREMFFAKDLLAFGSLREEPPRPPPPERRPWSAKRGDKQKILLQQTRGQGGDLLKRLPR